MTSPPCYRKAAGEFIQGFGAVFAKDYRVRRRVGAHKIADDAMRFFVSFGGNLAFEPGAPVDAGIPGHELGYLVEHRSAAKACWLRYLN